MTSPLVTPGDGGDVDGGASRSGAVLTRTVLVGALWLVVVGFAGSVVALLGAWTPVVGWVLALVALALAVRLTRRLPHVPITRGSAAMLVLAVLAVTVWTALTSSEQVLPRRDSASYFQATVQLAQTGQRPVPVDPSEVGGSQTLEVGGLTLESPAFYEIGSSEDPSVQPQFMPGPALVYSLPWWLGGARAAMVAPALVGGLALLGLGLLVAAAVGRWWAAPAVVLIGACFPWLHTARSTYSEPLAGLTLAGGLLALALATARSEHRRAAVAVSELAERRSRAARTALLAGVLVGGTTIVRIDALRETMLLVPVAALLLARGRSWGRELIVAAGASTAVGFAVAGVMSWRYLGEIAGSLVPLVGLVLLMSLLCWWLLRRAQGGWRLPDRLSRALPVGLAVSVLAVGAVLAARPLFMTVRQDPRDPGAMYVARMQAEQGLPVDGGRTYAEHSVEWLSWWVGVVPLVVAIVGLAVLAYRLGRVWTSGAATAIPVWAAPLLVATGSSLLTLWRPGITPDHPWADRRLLIVLPLVLVLVVAAAAWLWRERTRTPAGRVQAGLAVLAVITFAAAGVGESTWPHRAERVEVGSLAAVDEYCEEIERRDATLVVAVDDWALNQWPQVTRGMCGVPALAVEGSLRERPDKLRAALDELAGRVRADGGSVLLVAARGQSSLDVVDAEAIDLAVDVTVSEDMRILTERPDGTTELAIQVWTGLVPAR
ncbi:hypothetical protein GCM10022199_25440 [Marihabitans asiaticum]|uniref:4-amino-4-deoxy-L-arabinose transferase-like glycosyltransferase n=1 Tax=Marihabitans asiaticum TaxID=415218 RepID=A0A560WCS1_9MICO|nr:hypothetical protein [Marihabitans asiaticum]TWD15437.1 hypothetical protein FB557_0947 [Marihabitans asiaticum]